MMGISRSSLRQRRARNSSTESPQDRNERRPGKGGQRDAWTANWHRTKREDVCSTVKELSRRQRKDLRSCDWLLCLCFSVHVPSHNQEDVQIVGSRSGYYTLSTSPTRCENIFNPWQREVFPRRRVRSYYCLLLQWGGLHLFCISKVKFVVWTSEAQAQTRLMHAPTTANQCFKGPVCWLQWHLVVNLQNAPLDTRDCSSSINTMFL